MAGQPLRVLIVDDSATMRAMIRHSLSIDPLLQVVGEAADPHEARAAVKSLNVDVMTLDIEMPGMDGLDFLERVMRLRPMPVVMVSTLTSRGADASLRALELGAFDCVDKASLPGPRLATVVRAAAGSRPRAGRHLTPSLQDRAPQSRAPGGRTPGEMRGEGRLVAIGASTGGVEALLAIVSHLPAHGPPVVITQHMPAAFTGSLARRLDRSGAARVAEASDGAPLLGGHVYLAPGGATHLEVAGTGPWRCRLRKGDPVNGHRPAVDTLFHSVAHAAGAQAVGVILTGMGRDGAQGLLAMRQAGARTLGQDEASSVVYGMPRAAFELHAVEQQVHLDAMAGALLALCRAEEKVSH